LDSRNAGYRRGNIISWGWRRVMTGRVLTSS